MPRIRAASLAVFAFLSTSCGDRSDASDESAGAEWITEPEYRIGDVMEGDAAFGRVPYLRVGPSGHVFVVEGFTGHVSVWTPAGERLFSLGGPGEGPGDFMLPNRLHFEDTRFYVRDQSRFTWFGYDRRILETVPNPPTSVGWRGFPLRMDALLADGSFLGLSLLPFSVRLGLLGDDPVDKTPLFSVHETDGGWVSEPVYWIENRRSLYAIPTFEGNRVLTIRASRILSPTNTSSIRPLVRSWSPEWAARGLVPGRPILVEVTARGDTAWQRRLRFEPVPVTPEMAEVEIDALMERVRGMPDDEDMARWIRHAREVIDEDRPRASVRACREDALHGVVGAAVVADPTRRRTRSASGIPWTETRGRGHGAFCFPTGSSYTTRPTRTSGVYGGMSWTSTTSSVGGWCPRPAIGRGSQTGKVNAGRLRRARRRNAASPRPRGCRIPSGA